ncbi:MAG TPA: LAGLIDADG family homing endonuclease [Puia sp.]|jgi:hypothetical protein|nr:LAGLIDADG family homing endonuclease [Puia sp.]
MTDTELAYLAGIIDGEGCFFIGLFRTKATKNLLNYHTYIKISNTDKDLMDWIKENAHATNNQQERKTRVSKKERTIYNSQISGETLDDLIPKIYPFLIVKKRHCEIMIRMRSTFTKHRRLQKKEISQEIHDIRYQCYLELRSINSRFRDHPVKTLYSLAPCHPPVELRGLPSQSS